MHSVKTGKVNQTIMNAQRLKAQREHARAPLPAPALYSRAPTRPCKQICKVALALQRCVHEQAGRRVRAGAATLAPEAAVRAGFPRGADWAVHKFGGTCVSAAERISEASAVLATVRALPLSAGCVSCLPPVPLLLYPSHAQRRHTLHAHRGNCTTSDMRV